MDVAAMDVAAMDVAAMDVAAMDVAAMDVADEAVPDVAELASRDEDDEGWYSTRGLSRQVPALDPSG